MRIGVILMHQWSFTRTVSSSFHAALRLYLYTMTIRTSVMTQRNTPRVLLYLRRDDQKSWWFSAYHQQCADDSHNHFLVVSLD